MLGCRCKSSRRRLKGRPHQAALALSQAAALPSYCCQPLTQTTMTACQLASTVADEFRQHSPQSECNMFFQKSELNISFVYTWSPDDSMQPPLDASTGALGKADSVLSCRVLEAIDEVHPEDVCPPDCQRRHAFYFVRLQSGIYYHCGLCTKGPHTQEQNMPIQGGLA